MIKERTETDREALFSGAVGHERERKHTRPLKERGQGMEVPLWGFLTGNKKTADLWT